MTSDAGVPGAPRFDVVRRGYDRQQVDEHVARLHRVIARMRADLMARSQQQALPLHDVGHAVRMHPGAPQRPGAESPDAIGGFTDRMQSILQSAEEEAEEIRSKARLAAKAELDGIKYQREAMLAELAQVRHQIDGLRTRGPLPDGGGQPDRSPRPPMSAADAPRGVVPRPRPRPHPSAPGPQGNAAWPPGQNPMREQPPRRPVDPQQPEPSRTGSDAVTTAPSGPVPTRPDQSAPAAVPVPSFRIVGSTPQQPASTVHPAGDATAVRPAAGVPDPRSADAAAPPTPPAGPPRSSGAETVLLLKPQSAQARSDAPPRGQGDHNGDGATGATAGAPAAGKPDRTENGARNSPGERTGNGAGNGSVDRPGNGATAGPGNARTAGSGSAATTGSGSAATSGSGNGTTAGSGYGPTVGSGNATTAGSGNGRTAGSSNGPAAGSDDGTADASDKADADGTVDEASTDAGPVGVGEDGTTSGPAATGESTDVATQQSSSDLGVEDADSGRAAKPISTIRLTRSNRGGAESDDKTRDAGSASARTGGSEDTVAVPAWSPTSARKTASATPDEVPEQAEPSGKPDGGANSYGSGRSPSTSRSG